MHAGPARPLAASIVPQRVGKRVAMSAYYGGDSSVSE